MKQESSVVAQYNASLSTNQTNKDQENILREIIPTIADLCTKEALKKLHHFFLLEASYCHTTIAQILPHICHKIDPRQPFSIKNVRMYNWMLPNMPLICIAASFYPDTLAFLLQHGANPNYIDPQSHLSLLFLANENIAAIKSLVDYGADFRVINPGCNTSFYDYVTEMSHSEKPKCIVSQTAFGPVHLIMGRSEKLVESMREVKTCGLKAAASDRI